MADRIIQISTALNEGQDNTFGLSESGKMYTLIGVMRKDKENKTVSNDLGFPIWDYHWELLVDSPEQE